MAVSDVLSSSSAAPMPVERRVVLTSAALGLTSLTLPSASAAASVSEVTPTGAFSYSGDDRVLAYWEAVASGEVVTSGETGVSATGAFTGAAGTLSAGGPVYASFNAWNTAGQPDPSLYGDGGTGILSGSDGNTDLQGRVTSSAIDLVTEPSPTPYVAYTFDATASFILQTFVLYAARRGSPDAFNLAFYVQGPSGSYVLRRTAALTSSPANVVVQLGTSGVALTTGQSLTVRVYPYATSSSNSLKLYKPETSSSLSGLTVYDAIDASQGRFTDWSPAKVEGTARYTGTQYQEITAAFIGRPTD